MKRILSGIKPSGEVTLGNYLGAMKRWVQLSKEGKDEYIYFIPNLHALTNRPNPDELMANTLSDAAWLLAMGLNIDKSILFVQSLVPAHSELAWIINNFITMGELSRMTQFKDKSIKVGTQGQLVGMFDYPALMASDILLYDADEVPVGEDQTQHIELSRDVAYRFNKLYGQTFKMPKATVQKNGARIMNLQDPTKKMSKSDIDASGCIFLSDSAELITRKIMRAVTDSGDEIVAKRSKPALTNLLTIYSIISEREIKDIEKQYDNGTYAGFKRELAELIVKALSPIQTNFVAILEDKPRLMKILKEGSLKAEKISNLKLSEVKNKLGLI
jgi:tryptophanyl-tRNA synthetase